MTLFLTGDPRPIHFMGIAGAGMGALAMIAAHRGVVITGCDSEASGAGVDDLIALGVRVWRGHDPSHVEGVRAVVVTAAVPRDHPELERARALGLPVVRRADALGELVSGGGASLVAVAGTHGKTTTTVMVTEALTAAGRNPTGLAGGDLAAGRPHGRAAARGAGHAQRAQRGRRTRRAAGAGRGRAGRRGRVGGVPRCGTALRAIG